MLVSTNDHTIHFWDAATGELLNTLEGRADFVGYSPDGARWPAPRVNPTWCVSGTSRLIPRGADGRGRDFVGTDQEVFARPYRQLRGPFDKLRERAFSEPAPELVEGA